MLILIQIPDLSHFGKLEAQVLEQLERMEADRREREERRDAEIQQYQEERAERLKVEEEAKRRAEAEADEEKVWTLLTVNSMPQLFFNQMIKKL